MLIMIAMRHCCSLKDIIYRIKTREECEMIMLIGLPGCGKTTWVKKQVEANPEKRYTVIGTSSLIDKMKVSLHSSMNLKFSNQSSIRFIVTQVHFPKLEFPPLRSKSFLLTNMILIK